MNVNYHISPYPALLENMFAKIYEASSPDAEVDSIEIFEKDGSGVPTVGAGHQVPNSISFTGRDKVTHVVRLFTASAVLLHQYDVEPTVDTVTVFDPIYFKIGDGGTYTPIAESNVLSNPAFDGLEAKDLTIYQQGYMPLLPLIDYEITGDEITIINGTVFELDQPWYILKRPTVITNPVNDSVVGKGFGGFIDVVADLDYISSHLRKLIRFSGTGNYTFPALTSVPIGYNHSFTNFGTNPSTPRVNFSNGTLLYDGSPKSYLEIPFGSTATFTWDGTNWNMTENGIKESATSVVETIAQGSFTVGDVLAGDNIFTVTHGLALAYSYKVLGTLRGTVASRIHDDNVTWNVYDLQTNSFKLSMQEIYPGVQDLIFDWILVKV